MTKRFVLSTVGASLLLSYLTEDENQPWRSRLTNTANWGDDQVEGDEELSNKLTQLAQRARDDLAHCPVEKTRRVSAEMNGIYGLYGGQLDRGVEDMHWLIATDTTQGRLAVGIVKDHLRERGLKDVAVYMPPRLSTKDTASFSYGIKQLIAWCEENITGYRSSGYKVAFNLTGGFKSLQGYLNTIGMFYADEILYIFEAASADVIRIPRLPITIDMALVEGHGVKIALLASEVDFFPPSLTSGWQLPETFIEDFEECVTISAWGALVWNRAKETILSRDQILDFPRIDYTPEFKREYKAASPNQRIELQERLAKVAASMALSNGNTANLKTMGDVQYDNYVNRYTSDGEPIGHFRLNNQGRRASCVSRNGRLVMRHFGQHDDVNSNP